MNITIELTVRRETNEIQRVIHTVPELEAVIYSLKCEETNALSWCVNADEKELTIKITKS